MFYKKGNIERKHRTLPNTKKQKKTKLTPAQGKKKIQGKRRLLRDLIQGILWEEEGCRWGSTKGARKRHFRNSQITVKREGRVKKGGVRLALGSWNHKRRNIVIAREKKSQSHTF